MIELSVDKMTCGHCVSAVTQAVKSVDPEADVRVDLEARRVRIDGGRSSLDAVSTALAGAGYPATPASERAPATARKSGCCCG